MADENFGIVVEINPRPALEGTAKVDQALEKNENSAREFERAAREAMRSVEKTARESARAQEKAARELARASAAAARDAAAVAKKEARDVAEVAKKEAAEREKVERFMAKRTADYAARVAGDLRSAQDKLAASYKAIVGPAAEYREKLNQILQLERQGAISAAQRASAVRGMQREMAQFSAKQQGGVRGAVSEIAASQFGAVAGPAAAAAVAAKAAQELVRLGDEYVALTNKVKASTDSEVEASIVRERLFKSAADARVGVQSLTEIYSAARIATKDLGTSQGELLRVSELLAKATRGVGEANRSAGLQQFGQALTKGRLQAEELMSIMENIPKVGVLLAQGMGVTVGELRKLAEQGKVSTQDMLDAIQKVGPEIEEQFAKSAGTSAESFQVLKDKVMGTVGGFAQQINLNKGIAVVLGEVGEALTFIGKQVEAQVAVWKSIDDATGGWLGKLVSAKGLFGNINELSGRIAGQYLFGAEMLERQKGWSERLTREAEKHTAELQKQENLLRNSTFFTGYNKDEKGRATGYGVAGNFLRDSIDVARNPTRYKIDKLEAREAAKAAREHERAAREAAAAWKEWMGDVGSSGAGVLERVKLRIEGTTDAIRDEAAAAIEAAEAQRRFGDGVADLGDKIGSKLGGFFESMKQAGAQVTETLTEVDPVVADFGATMAESLGAGLNSALDAVVDFANGTKVSIGDMVRSVIIDLERALLKFLAFQAIKATIGVSTGGFGGILAGALGINLGNNATGGSYVVPSTGGGGVDSVPIYARATPGERVTFTPPGKPGPGESGAPANVNVRSIIVADLAAASLEAMRSPDGTRAIISVIASNPGAVRAAVGR